MAMWHDHAEMDVVLVDPINVGKRQRRKEGEGTAAMLPQMIHSGDERWPVGSSDGGAGDSCETHDDGDGARHGSPARSGEDECDPASVRERQRTPTRRRGDRRTGMTA